MRNIILLFILQALAHFFSKKKQSRAEAEGKPAQRAMRLIAMEIATPIVIEFLIRRFSRKDTGKKLAGI